MSFLGTNHSAKGTMDEVIQMVRRFFKGRRLKEEEQQIAGAEGYGWWLNEGSARIYIFLQDAAGGPVIRVTSPIVYIPQQRREDFYRHLLDMNTDLTSCALATSEDAVLVVAQRHINQLDQEELDDMIWNVAYVADVLDDKLASEFATRKYQS
jgi:hypothetical protein